MKCQKSCGPHLGKLVHQLLRVATFTYNLYFRCMIAHWKGIIEEINFGGNIKGTSIFLPIFPKTSFRASKWPWKLKNAKNSKLPKLLENYFEPVGKGGWPPISTWITSRHPKYQRKRKRNKKNIAAAVTPHKMMKKWPT